LLKLNHGLIPLNIRQDCTRRHTMLIDGKSIWAKKKRL
jgi:hypothetical protein